MRNKLLTAWSKWKQISDRALRFQTNILLTILYFTILAPLGLWYRFTHNLFQTKSPTSNWYPWPHDHVDDEIRQM